MSMPNEPKIRPAQEFRLGHVKATVWANPVTGSVRHSVTLSRLYKEGSSWKTSASFGRDDLPLVARVADQAHAWIFSQAGGGREGEGGQNEAQEGSQAS